MFDYLSKYNLTEEDREAVRMILLKRMHNRLRIKYITKWLNMRTRRKINAFANSGLSSDLIKDLLEIGLIQSQGAGKPFIPTERGKQSLRRGYISYHPDKSAKRANIIACMALIVSIVNLDEVRKLIREACRAIATLL